MNRRSAALLCLALLPLIVAPPARALPPSGYIETSAGRSGNGDGGPAVNALVTDTDHITVDSAGRLVFADDNRVRRIDAAGIVETIAGGGNGSDGRPAKEVALGHVSAVAYGPDGALFIAEDYDGRIRRVDPVSGILTTIAGNGECEYSGDGGLAIHAQLCGPRALVVSPTGDVFVADQYNDRVRKIGAANGKMTTVAGGGGGDGRAGRAVDAWIGRPSGLAMDRSGSLWIAGRLNDAVFVVDPDGFISVAAEPYHPVDLALGPDDVPYVVENGEVVRRIEPDGTLVNVVGPGTYNVRGDGGLATEAFIRRAAGITLDLQGNLYVVEDSSPRIRRVDAVTGVIETVAGPYGDGPSALDAYLGAPTAAAFGPDGRLFFADGRHRVIRVIGSDGSISTVWGDGEPAGQSWFAGEFGMPGDIDFDAAGRLYVADTAGPIFRRSPAGEIEMIACWCPTRGRWPIGLAAGFGTLEGYTFFTLFDVSYVVVIRPDRSQGVLGAAEYCNIEHGNYNGDGLPVSQTNFCRPTAMDVDEAGNLFIVDSENFRIRKVDATTGIVSTVAGNGVRRGALAGDGGRAVDAVLANPSGVRVASDGTVYIIDGPRVRRVTPDGMIMTVAGNGSSAYSGDGGPAVHAGIDVRDVAIGPNNILYIAAGSNGRIRVMREGPSMNVSPQVLDFGDRTATTSGPANRVTIRNVWRHPIEVASSLDGPNAAEFVVHDDGCSGRTLAAGATCSIDIAPAPTGLGVRSATLVLSAPDAVDARIDLHVRGTSPVAISPSALPFGGVEIGSASAPLSATISNIGSSPQLLGQAVIAGASAGEFSIATDACSNVSLAAGASCKIDARFAPNASGLRTAKLSISVPAYAQTLEVAVSGTGLTVVGAQPSGLEFGTHPPGAEGGTRTTTLTNSGRAAFMTSPATIIGPGAADYSIQGTTCPGALPPGASCSLTVRFSPTTTGLRAATLLQHGNVAGGAVAVSLSGWGTDTTPPETVFVTKDSAILIGGVDSIEASVTDGQTGVKEATVVLAPLGGNSRTLKPGLQCSADRRTCTWRVALSIVPGIYEVRAWASDQASNIESPGPSITVVVL